MAAKDLRSVARTTKYPLEAFLFVQRGLDFTVRRIHGEMEESKSPAGANGTARQVREPESRHVSGRDLCFGLRDFAADQYGLLARTVLRRWNIQGCEDFGYIVFAMVDAGLMHKTEDDTMADFTDIYAFANAFTPELSLSSETV